MCNLGFFKEQNEERWRAPSETTSAQNLNSVRKTVPFDSLCFPLSGGFMPQKCNYRPIDLLFVWRTRHTCERSIMC